MDASTGTSSDECDRNYKGNNITVCGNVTAVKNERRNARNKMSRVQCGAKKSI